MSRILIGNIIVVVVLLLAIFYDIDHINLYFVIVYAILHVLTVLEVYIISRRNISSEVSLTHSSNYSTLKEFILSVLLFIVIYGGFLYLFRLFTLNYAIILISIAILSFAIQFYISNKRPSPTLFINKTDLFVNALFSKKYNLEILKSLTFDDYTDTYTAEFENSKKLRIKQNDFAESDLKSFIEFMKAKSHFNVSQSTNIETN